MDIQKLNPGQLRERAIAQSNQRAPASTPSSTGVSGRPAVDVELSSAAQTLRQVTGDARPPFDQARVEAIRGAIANGNYHVDPQRLAQNFMRIESDIFQ